MKKIIGLFISLVFIILKLCSCHSEQAYKTEFGLLKCPNLNPIEGYYLPVGTFFPQRSLYHYRDNPIKQYSDNINTFDPKVCKFISSHVYQDIYVENNS